MSRAPKFTISIIAMNGVDMTRKCIASVLANSKNYELILTDNASSDQTKEYFEELKTSAKVPVRVVHNEKNLGFAEPNNHALTLAKGKYFITLNNDATVPRDWLKALELPFKILENVAITGPAGSCCSLAAPYPSFHGSVGLPFEYVEGSCLCIPTALARKHELFANYMHFAYGEDVDLSLRMQARGYKIAPGIFNITHARAATSKFIPDIREIQRANHAALLKKWGNYLKHGHKFDLPIVVRRKGALGDVLLVTPIVRALREEFPRSEIFVETQHPEVFRDNPHVTKVGAAFPEVYRWARIIELDMAYEKRFEYAYIDGYIKEAMLTGEIDKRIELFGLPEITEDPDQDIIVLHAQKSWPGRTWPAERWAELSQALLSKGYRTALVGTADNTSIPHHYDFRGRTTLHQLANLIRGAGLFIGIDSAPLHVATAMGCRSIGLYGCTRSDYVITDASKHIALNADPKIPCAARRHSGVMTYLDCPPDCIESITVEDVLKHV